MRSARDRHRSRSWPGGSGPSTCTRCRRCCTTNPKRIAPEVERHVRRASASATSGSCVAYADCGTYGALDEVCERYGIARLAGSDCYDVYAGAEQYRALLEQEPGTYLLTDFLAASFQRSVMVELGLDRYPDLRDDYFRHYTRVVWLTQRRTPLLQSAAEEAAASIGLPLEVVDVGIRRPRGRARAALGDGLPRAVRLPA